MENESRGLFSEQMEIESTPIPAQGFTPPGSPKKKGKKVAVVVSVCIAAVALIAAAVIVFVMFFGAGYKLRNPAAIASKNFKVTNAMMTVLIMDQASQMASYGLDTSKPLSEQEISEGQTWFDYLFEQSKGYVEQILVLAEQSLAEGKTFNEEDLKWLDSFTEDLKTGADSAKKTVKEYIESIYGKGIKESDIRAYYELYRRALNQYQSTYDSIKYTDDELQKHFEENTAKFLYADYIVYSVKAETSDDMTEAQTKSAMAAAKKAAEKIAENHTSETFNSAIKNHLLSLKDSDGKAEYTKEDADKEIESMLVNLHPYGEEDELDKWLFDDARKNGDTKVTENTGDYTVYFMKKTKYRNEAPATIDVRHILMKFTEFDSNEAALDEAERVYDEWKAGDATEDSFAALAKEHSDDGNAADGGIYEGVTPGQMVASFDSWCFDPSRKSGDAGIVETSFGYHIMYFVKSGEVAWKAAALDTLKSDEYTKRYDEWKKAHSVTVNDKKIKELKL